MNDVRTLGEFGDDHSDGYSKRHTELRFTGNWFVDAGILGFVNLMEEVYGWSLEDLKKFLKESPETIYYWYFPIAFVHHNHKVRDTGIQLPKEALSEADCKDNLFEEAWNLICKHYSTTTKKGKEKIDLGSSGPYYYFHNLLFFQPGRSKEKQKEDFMEVIGIKAVNKEILIHMDKTINKFLPSADESSNVSYVKSFVETSNLKYLLPNFVFILTFPFAFLSKDHYKANTLFYSPNLSFTYNVNKRLEKLLESQKQYKSILNVTWEAILDSIMETESIWSLENMYMIKYNVGKNQRLLSAEYIGIPKLQANIILDDTIRNALNKNVQVRNKKNPVWVWLLEEFIKNKPLFPLVLNNLQLRINEINMYTSLNTLIYTLSTDNQIKYLEKNKLFTPDFFKKYRETLFNIKDDFRKMIAPYNNISKVFTRDERDKLSRPLISTVRKRNRKAFTNILLKALLSKNNSNQETIKSLNKYLFDNIVLNDKNWENYALAFIAGLVYGGIEDGRYGEES